MIKDTLNDVALSLSENSPKIMIFMGVTSLITAGVWACIKTKNDLPDAIHESNCRIDDVHDKRETQSEEEYSAMEYKKDLTEAYVRKGIRVVKVYTGPTVLTIIGVALIFTGEHKLLVSLASMTATAEMYSEAYEKLKSKVDENFGEGTAENLMMGGKLKKTKEFKESDWEFTDDPEDIYTFRFDQTNPEWVDDRKLLYDKLSTMQSAMTDVMVSRLKTDIYGNVERPGYYFLHEALHMLCIEPEAEGKIDIAQNAGNIFDPKNPIGDNFIDIGLDNPRNVAFFFEPGTDPKDRIFRRDPIDHNDLLYLNFNCDGIIGPRINPNSRFEINFKRKPVIA